MRFFNNKNVQVSDLLRTMPTSFMKSFDDHVLLLGDTSSLNFNHHAGALKVNDPHIGTIEDDESVGFYLHPCLALSASGGYPLGYGSIQVWSHRFGREKRDKKELVNLPIEEKESHKWLQGVYESWTNLPSARQITVIYDRESDIYELLSRIPDQRTELLIRSSSDRVLDNGKKLSEEVKDWECAGQVELDLAATDKRKGRMAQLEVKYGKVRIRKPVNRKKVIPKDADIVELQVVDVCELSGSVPEGEEPIHWRLLTTHQVDSLEFALQIVQWYAFRWWIEELFRMIKRKGFQIENSQLHTGEALQKMLVLTLEAALKVLSLRQSRYQVAENEQPIETCFSEQEVSFLEAVAPQYNGKTELQRNPHPVKTLKWAAWIIASMSGWNPRRSKGKIRPFGVVSLIRGYQRFQMQFDGWKVAIQNQDKKNYSP